MNFNIKLQELRKKKGLSQEELAETLYVSRAAISKWESGRGYPNIDSLKRISKLFSISIDELLSGEELIFLAEEDKKQKENNLRDLIFGLLDICVLLLLFLPFFAQRYNDLINEVSLLSLSFTNNYLNILYLIIVILIILFGICLLALQNNNNLFWLRLKHKLSLFLNVFGIILFIISLQPYAAIFLFVFLCIKILVCLKK